MKLLYYDCFAGISGDMNLGALLDLGVELSFLRAELDKLKLDEYALEVGREKRGGIAGTRVKVIIPDDARRSRRTPGIINKLIEDSSLSDAVKQQSLEIFSRLAEAEAKVHAIPVAKVHFHEVGAVDAIVDIVGAVIALDHLAVDQVICSALELGGGLVECAHGTLPVPAPATLELLRGLPTRSGAVPFEATTPTGAAIISTVADAFSATTEFTPLKVGYGVGGRDGPIPNLVRVILAEQPALMKGEQERMLIECNIDDMSPELYDYVMERLFAEGALDVWLTPVIMKKGRPGVVLSVLCRRDLVETLSELLLTETTSLGVRRLAVARTALERVTQQINTQFGAIPVKIASFKDAPLKAKPEYAVCKRIAQEKGIPIKLVYEEVDRCLKYPSR